MGTEKAPIELDEAFPRGVGQPAVRAFTGAGYTHFKQLSGVKRSELAALHGVGPKSLRIIQQALIDSGLEPMT